MTEKTKKIIRITSLFFVAGGSVGAYLTGASEAGITGIVAGAIAIAVGAIAFIKSILK